MYTVSRVGGFNVPLLSNRSLLQAGIATLLLAMQGSVTAQNCPADLEWPGLAAAPPGSVTQVSMATSVAWPESKILRSVITDRHTLARTSLAEVPLPLPAVGATVCDPVFGTSVTRASGTGFGLYLQDAFSYSNNWYLGAGSSGVLTAFGFDPTTGKPRLGSNGQPLVLPLSPNMLPTVSSGSNCIITTAVWSKKEENILYMAACGGRIFKYNLAAYDPARPMAGLVAGSNARSVASWPTCVASNTICRKGPVFLDFNDKFFGIAGDGLGAYMSFQVSDDDLTFSGFMTRNSGYKNVQGLFVYRPWNNSFWFAVGAVGNPDPALLLRVQWNGVPVNRRIIGSNLDYSGRYLGVYICNETPVNLDSCGTAKGYVINLDTVSTSTSLQDAVPFIEDKISHGSYISGLATGYKGSLQTIQVQYFTGTSELKTLVQPNLFGDRTWWGNYTAASSRVIGPTGDQLAGLYASYTFDTVNGSPAALSACPSRNCLYGNELILFNLTGTHFIRLAHTRSLIQEYGLESYWDLPRPSISRDGKYVIYSSNWGIPSVRNQSNVSLYTVLTPAAWQTLLDDAVTVTPVTATVTPEEYLRLTVSHPANGSGASLLIQDFNKSAANKVGACFFRMITLASDAGIEGFFATVGLPSSPVLQNSQCQINVATSASNPSTHGNTEYQVDVYFKKVWAGKTLRAVGIEAGGTKWKDASNIKVDSGTSLKWVSIPGMLPVNATPSQVENPSSIQNFAVGYLANKIKPGQYFEFNYGSGVPSNYSVSLTPVLPSWNSQQSFLATAYAFQTGSAAEILFTQDSGARNLARLTRSGSNSIIRLTFLVGKVEFSMDGRLITTATIPTSLTELYLVANMIGMRSAFLSPTVGMR